MTEQLTKRLFGLTVTAERTRDDGTPEIGMQNVVSLLVGNADILEASLEHARQLYPEAEKWREHKVVWTELEQNMMFGPYRLTWDAKDTRLEAE